MRMLTASMRHCLRNLARFDGRDRPRDFWPYASVLVAALMLGSAAAITPEMTTWSDKIMAFVAAHPDQTEVVQRGTSQVIKIRGRHPELIPDFSGFVGAMQIMSVLAVALLAAAVARRLHDTGRSDLWGLAPLPFLAVGLILIPRTIIGMTTGHPPQLATISMVFGILFVNTIFYLIALMRLAFLLSRDSEPAPNRFGAPVD